MDLIARIADVIIPVFLIVAIGYGYARRGVPDMSAFNRIALDVLAPLLVYSALASHDFRMADHSRFADRRHRADPGQRPAGLAAGQSSLAPNRARWCRW